MSENDITHDPRPGDWAVPAPALPYASKEASRRTAAGGKLCHPCRATGKTACLNCDGIGVLEPGIGLTEVDPTREIEKAFEALRAVRRALDQILPPSPPPEAPDDRS